MRLFLCALLPLVFFIGEAAKPKLYRCLQPDGTTVIQDVRCLATALKKAPAKTITAKPKPKTTRQAVTNTTKPNIRANPNFSRKRITGRSPYFTFGWSSFIPINWSSQVQSNQHFEETYWSRDILTAPSDFKKGVKLRAYKNTMNSGNIGAFAQALSLYHGIRDNNDFTLIDSQFKSHNRFKVFNIKYQQPQGLITTTEFYIDESFNDLFVVTVQATASELVTQWQLANQIIKNL